MKKTIVITSIFDPTEAVVSFSRMKDYELIVVGDKKTPENWQCENVQYISIAQQEKSGFELAKTLPYNHYCRKMIGYLIAIQNGAEYIVDTDDDNIPKENWVFPEFENKFDCTPENNGFINIYQLYTRQKIWPRGLPLNLIAKPIMWLYNYKLGFINATVVQKRNPHDYMKDFISEIPMYEHCEKVIELVSGAISVSESIETNLYNAYKALLEKNIVSEKEMETLQAWLADWKNLS